MKPVYPGDTIQAHAYREAEDGEGKPKPDQPPQGVVAWDVEVKNQTAESVAVYTILTLVRRRGE